MMVGAIGYGGMTYVWGRSQYPYGNMAVRGTAAIAPVSGQRGRVSMAAIAPASGQKGSAAASAGVRGAAPVSGQESGAPAATSVGGAAAGAAGARFTPSELPYIPEGYGPEELATRTRIQFPGLGVPPEEWAEAQSRLPWAKADDEKDIPGIEKKDAKEGVPGVEDTKSAAEVAEDAKCETCEKRKYQDESDDPGVSFQTATKVDPRAAQAAVRGHEMEHVVRERAKAEREGRRVVSQSVTYHSGICPECGKFYVSGGTTRTVTAADNSADDMKELLRKRFAGTALGASLDATA